MNKILLVEDEKGISSMEKNYLQKAGFNVIQAFDGEEALNLFKENSFDLIVLDLMIPKISGEKVLETIRKNSNIPIIMVTAKVSENDIVENLRNGADDYIKKPFSANELVERVKTVLRRSKNITKSSIIKSSDSKIIIDLENHRLLKNNQEIFLTKNEFLILHTLFNNQNKTFTRNEIIEISFGYDYEAFDRAIDTHIKNIRQKIEDDPKNPKYIKTIYGLGYKAGE